ncbi:MATE family efflux transporter [Duncaniella dubosii]|uniref:MATE family efflux transporter n=1 Tax=Duncaniella dubosii TaxID=2518971 RepID=UPI003F677299
MQPIVGYNYGAGKIHRLRRAYWLAVGVSTCIVSIGQLAGLTIPEQIGRAFTTDAGFDIRNSAMPTHITARIHCRRFSGCFYTLFQSIGKASASIFLSLARQVLFLIPLLLILPPEFGLDGVWVAFPTSDLIATAVTCLMVTYQFAQFHKREKELSVA